MSRIAAGGMTLRGPRDLVAHNHEALLEPRDRLPRDHPARANGGVLGAAFEPREQSSGAGDEPHEQPAAVGGMGAQVVHASEPLAALRAHHRADQIACTDHERGNFAIVGARRSSPFPRPRSRAFAFRWMTVSRWSTRSHGTRITS